MGDMADDFCYGGRCAEEYDDIETVAQQPQERHCSQDHQALAIDYVRVCPECGVVTH